VGGIIILIHSAMKFGIFSDLALMQAGLITLVAWVI
jgi:hypothetical protein